MFLGTVESVAVKVKEGINTGRETCHCLPAVGNEKERRDEPDF